MNNGGWVKYEPRRKPGRTHMRLIVTDSGNVWNHHNPILEKYKESVLVICLDGKKITDKYDCFVSPYKSVGMGIDWYGDEDQRLRALKSVSEELKKTAKA